MTKAKFFKNNGLITGFTLSGHTNFNQHGQDVLCAGVSAVSQSTCLGVIKVLKLDAKMVKDDNKGFLSLDLKSLERNQILQAQTLLETLKQSLEYISIGNEKFIKVENYDEIY